MTDAVFPSDAGPSSVQAQSGSGIHSTETSPTILTPSSSLDSNATVHNANYNSASAPAAQNYNPHTGQTYLVYGNNPAHAAPYAGQWQPAPQFQGPPPPIPSNFYNPPSSIPVNPLNDRRFTGGPRVNMPMPGPPEPQRHGGLVFNIPRPPEAARDARYERPINYGGPINWQPWRQPSASEHGAEPDIDTCSNVAVACEGKQNQQGDGVIGPRMMDFMSEFEKSRYMDGLGLPAEGNSPEARLFRALNMSHYILIEHMDKAQKEMKQYVCSTVNKVADHTQNSLGRKLYLLQKHVVELSKERIETKPVEPCFATLSCEPAQPTPHHPVDFETEDNRSLQHLEIAILKLWAHIDKIKDENHLHKEEKAERKEIEELLAGELLYHNRTMEKMKAKINSMSTEVNSCWKEIHKLQDAMKELEDVTFSRKLPAVKPTAANSCINEDSQIPLAPAGVVADPKELLQKINEELEHLDGRHRGKGALGEGFEDECSCDLCGKARAGKSAGVTVESGHDGCNTAEEGMKAKGKEKVTKEETAPTHPRAVARKATVGNYLAALDLTTLDHAVVTNVTPTSPILQKWRDAYNRSIQGNQQVLELTRPNGDVVILLVQPNEGAQKLEKRGYGLSDEEPGSPAAGGMSNSLYNSSSVNSLEVIYPLRPPTSTLREALGAIGHPPHPPHPTLDSPFGGKASTAPPPNIRTTKPLQLQTKSTDPTAPKLPVNIQSQLQSLAPQEVLNTKAEEEPMKMIERPFENVPYHMYRQKEVEVWEEDVMQRFGRAEKEPTDVLNFIDEALSKMRGYETGMKELKARAAMAEHSDGGMHLATAPRLYIQVDTTPKRHSSPAWTGPKRVEVEEVKDEADPPGKGDKEANGVDEKELVEDSHPLWI